MSAVEKRNLISVEDYLAGELQAQVKHEYLGGVVWAKAGAKNTHNIIATDALLALGKRLGDQPCQPYNSDTKIRVELPGEERFYYPDASVCCQPNSGDDSYQDRPALIIEVLSRSTRRIDTGEKKDAYVTIPSLIAYILVEQETATVIVYRRGKRIFAREDYEGLEAVIPLPEIAIELPLSEVYRRVTFRAEPLGEEE